MRVACENAINTEKRCPSGRWASAAVKLARWCILAIMLLTLFGGLLQDLGVPRSVVYIADLFDVALLVCIVLSGRMNRLQEAVPAVAAMGLWLVYSIVNGLLKGQPLLPMLWAIRNWGRGFVFFCGCVMFLQKSDFPGVFRWLTGIYWVNFLLICGEYLILDKSGDELGGIFGSEIGCNGANNILFSAILVAALCLDLHQDRLSLHTVLLLFSVMVIAALSELKITYYFFIIAVLLLVILYAVWGNIRRKTVVLTLLSAAAALALGLWLLSRLFPYAFSVIIGRKSYFFYEEASRIAYKISRVRFISETNEQVFHGSPLLNLTGFGFGSYEYSRYSQLIGPLYRQYGELNCLYFSHQSLFLEGGFIGLVLFAGIPAAFGTEHGLKLLRHGKMDAWHTYSVVLSLFLLVSLVYNNAYRTELSFLMYFAMAAGYMLAGQETSNQAV